MQHKQEHKTTIKVKVSDLTQYMLCPRLVYFRARGHKQSGIAKGKERSVIENILLKELAFDLHKVYGGEVDEEGGGVERGEGEEEDARRLIEEIVDGVERIYSAELKGLETDFVEAVKKDFVCNMSAESAEWLKKVRNGNGLLELEEAYGYEREHTMVSEKLSMSGSVDKLIRTGEEFIPCVIKTGRCPEYGVWKSDRMQLAAYAMLIEEEYETTVKRGFVEYIRNAEFRESRILKRDKALALQVLKRVKRIKGGVFPEKGENAPCDNCSFVERCETRKTLLSKLFGK
ncbi:MAG: Dna2/Cas4 domain-containing protein [Methanomicrobia archaeon]|nr:Dna2/Cas4 domain-containing protein [Methanomicrobia archaeon]